MRLLIRLASGLLGLSMVLTMPALANDISNSTWSETDSSNNSASPNGWTSGVMLPSQVEPTARAMMGALKRTWNRENPTTSTTGSSPHYVLTLSVAPSSYVQGETYCFKANFTSAGGDDLNVNSLGAKALYKSLSAGVIAIGAGDIQSGQQVCAAYDAATGFQVINVAFAGASAGPSWAGSYGNYDINRYVVNGFPKSAEFGGNSPNVVHVLEGAIDIPGTATGASTFGSGVAGYARTASTGLGGVGVFGSGMANVASSSVWGANTLATNSPTTAIVTNTGLTGVHTYGLEVDTNIMKSGGVAPTNVDALGILVAGGSETQVGSGGESFAITISPLGQFASPAIPWQTAFLSQNGAATNGLVLQAQSSVLTSTDSQPILFSSYNSGSTQTTAEIQFTQGGVFTFTNNTTVATSFVMAGPHTSFSIIPSGVSLPQQNSGAGQPSGQIVFTNSANNSSAINMDQNDVFQFVNNGSTPLYQFTINSTGIMQIKTGGPVIQQIQTSSTGGGLYVCIDNSGILYKKSACP